MATRTTNRYGKIVVTNRAIAHVAEMTLSECYGVASGSVVDIETLDNKIRLSLDLHLLYGVTPLAVCDTVRSQVKYGIENFCGMEVRAMNINVVGIK